MRYFISQPMNGKSNDEIKNERQAIIDRIKRGDKDAIIIDSFFENVPHDVKPLWYLGESIKKMSEADVVYFATGWAKARGCQIEHECAVKYNLQIYELI